jgi:hypothetical protein
MIAKIVQGQGQKNGKRADKLLVLDEIDGWG